MAKKYDKEERIPRPAKPKDKTLSIETLRDDILKFTSITKVSLPCLQLEVRKLNYLVNIYMVDSQTFYAVFFDPQGTTSLRFDTEAALIDWLNQMNAGDSKLASITAYSNEQETRLITIHDYNRYLLELK
jgi:hypothetical protein